MNSDICVIGIYFGNLRKDFPLWLKSCQYNCDIDFLLFTDSDCSCYDIPNNVNIYKSTLSEVAKLASEKLGFKIALNHPYKLCDFKPAYGIIFKDFIKDYKYWGHCDFDMMFGRIRFFTKFYNIYDYNHFLTQGHLSFYQNTPETDNYIYLEGGDSDVKTIFTSNKNFAFDEIFGIGKLYKQHNIPQFDKNIYADISPIYKRLRRSPYYHFDIKPKDYDNQLFIWKKGIVYWMYIDEAGNLSEEEMLYIHYQKRKFSFEIENLKESEIIVFTPKKIIPWKGEISKSDLVKLNHKNIIKDWIDFSIWKLKKLYQRLRNKYKQLYCH